jgi:hypothetical protein
MGRLHDAGVGAPGVARAVRRTRERNPQGEFRLLNFPAKPLKLEIGFCNIDRHKRDLDPVFQIEPQTHRLVGSQGNNGTGNDM